MDTTWSYHGQEVMVTFVPLSNKNIQIIPFDH